LSGKKGLSMTMVQRLRARFGVPADAAAASKEGGEGEDEAEGGVMDCL
jgi:hypothetical protein